MDTTYYDPVHQITPEFDKKTGKDEWVGRRIVKSFDDHGDFEGVIYGVDTDVNKKGYRLFLVHYFDDPDDGEAMWTEEVFRYA